MRRILLILPAIILALASYSRTIIVKNLEELHAASKNAIPGDVIILKNGEWKDVQIKLESKGTKEKPIIYKAEKPGAVIITGNSRLALGGEYMEVQGLLFTRGYSGDKAVIEFRTSKDKLANHCRVTGCAIDGFNNPKRMDENYWVALYGKNNRLDHCSFKNKNNIGVLLAVILDDERSRENFHRIDHNYFGTRMPLASNGGEIIRVGVSQHCQFNSNTQITDNFFENCNGETEIVSIKSGTNVVKGNLFKGCQGAVVLRHGDNNTVENNIFLGNGKDETGGVRVINKGQWVVNNFFYKCRGKNFRSPLSIMNGIPNSPANRYVQVTDAVIANNSFVECTPVSLGEGSDAERTLPPDNVLFFNNLYYNTSDSSIYRVLDKTSGVRFAGNELNASSKYFIKLGPDLTLFRATQKLSRKDDIILPLSQVKGAVAIPDSLRKISQQRLGHSLSTKPGFNGPELLKQIIQNAEKSCGTGWFENFEERLSASQNVVSCLNAGQIYAQIEKQVPVTILLTGKQYHFDKPLVITSQVYFKSPENKTLFFSSEKIKTIFELGGKGYLRLDSFAIEGKAIKATHFISSADNGSSDRFILSITKCSVSNLDRKNGCENFFFANKSIVSEYISISESHFENNNVNFLMMNEEKDDKGYYNAEWITLLGNSFSNMQGIFMDIYRGGNDESTWGPLLLLSNNKFKNCKAENNPLIKLTGVQRTYITKNNFIDCNPGSKLIVYRDIVRAEHVLIENPLSNSGEIEKNIFVHELTTNIK